MTEREDFPAGESSETRDFELPPMEEDGPPTGREHTAEPADELLPPPAADEPPDETERRDWDMP